MRKYIFTLMVMASGSAATAADDFFQSVPTTRTAAVRASGAPWTSKAWLQQKTGWGYRRPAAPFSRDRADLTRTESELYAELDWRHAGWQARLAGSLVQDWLPDLEQGSYWSGYALTPAQRSARRWRREISDSYLAWKNDDWWLKAGVQTLAWGESESQKITDVLARRDQRWPGQEDLEALRLPVPAVSITWRNRLDLIALPVMPGDRQPAAFDEFDPYIRLRGPENNNFTVHVEEKDKPGWAARWHTRRPGLDVQWMLADVYSFDLAPASWQWSGPENHDSLPTLQSVVVTPWRQQVAGLAMQTVRGNWLLKTEQAWHHNTRMATRDPLANWQSHDQWRAMVAAEFSGINDLTVTGEFSWRHTRSHESALADAEWQTGQALRIRYVLLNERLALGGLALRLMGGQGQVWRTSVDWSLSDHWAVGLSLIDYQAASDRQLLYDYRHNDTLMLTLRRSLL